MTSTLPTLQVPGIVGTITASIIGRVQDWPHTLAISVPPNGKTLFYCELHKCTFSPRRAGCPECLTVDIQAMPKMGGVIGF